MSHTRLAIGGIVLALVAAATGAPVAARTEERAGQAGTGLVLGQMPFVDATPGGPVNGRVRIANANLPYATKVKKALTMIKADARPDFITLNEVYQHSIADLEGYLPGYRAYRDPVRSKVRNVGQSVNNAIMWRHGAWRMLDGGRVQFVEDDHVIMGRQRVRWDRYAVWGLFQRRSDKAVVAVISAHHMTNPTRSRQWGRQPFTRAEQYDLGMDYLIELTEQLSAYGPVLLGGDMNSHANNGAWAAVPRMAEAGYGYTKDQGVMYQFFPSTVTPVAHRQLNVPSDHPVNISGLKMNKTGPVAR